MARLVGVFNTAHTPFCYMPPERWNDVRAQRSLREDVPLDDLEENRRKSQRIRDAFATLRSSIEVLAPDVLIVFGDDQLECFDFNNFPAMAVYVGEEYEGNLSGSDYRLAAAAGVAADRTARQKQKLHGHPELATGILRGLMQRGFDPAFSMDMPKPERGVGHAILRPAESLTDFSTPIVPVLLNCYYAPQPTARRCYEMGKAVRESIEDFPRDLKVAVVGSGGLWHTPGARDAYLDEEFDRAELDLLAAGDIRGMAEYFDSYEVPEGDRSQYVGDRGRGTTGMRGFGGPQGGTRETCNWIAAAAVADGSKTTIIDYVPVYASPVGAGFSMCTDV